MEKTKDANQVPWRYQLTAITSVKQGFDEISSCNNLLERHLRSGENNQNSQIYISRPKDRSPSVAALSQLNDRARLLPLFHS